KSGSSGLSQHFTRCGLSPMERRNELIDCRPRERFNQRRRTSPIERPSMRAIPWPPTLLLANSRVRHILAILEVVGAASVGRTWRSREAQALVDLTHALF